MFSIHSSLIVFKIFCQKCSLNMTSCKKLIFSLFTLYDTEKQSKISNAIVKKCLTQLLKSDLFSITHGLQYEETKIFKCIKRNVNNDTIMDKTKKILKTAMKLKRYKRCKKKKLQNYCIFSQGCGSSQIFNASPSSSS